MKLLFLPIACLGLFLASGCESDLPHAVSSALAVREAPRSKDFKGSSRAVFEAARSSLKDMGYTLTHAGAAEGRIEGVSGIAEGTEAHSSRQVMVKVRIEEEDDGICTVTASFIDVLEQDAGAQPSMASQSPVREPALYTALFGHIQDALREQAQAPAK
jgi:hypothetical protein